MRAGLDEPIDGLRLVTRIGALKYTSYEATAIQPLIAHSPIFSWLYSIVSVRAFAAVLSLVPGGHIIQVVRCLVSGLPEGTGPDLRRVRRVRRL